MRTDMLQEALEELNGSTADIEACALISLDGLMIASALPQGMDGAELLAKSLQTERVAFVPGRAFFADGSNGNTLRLSFSCADEAAIDEGMKRLGRLIRAQG